MIRPKNETDDLLLSKTKNYETLIKQTHTKPQETLENKNIKPRETLSFRPPISVEGCWMTGITSLQVYNPIFNITEENNKLEIFTDNFKEFSFEELKDELEEILSTSDIKPSHLKHEIIAPCIIQTYNKLRSEKSSTDGYVIFLLGYARSSFRDF